MTSSRRMGPENSKTRFLLLDTAERLMLEEGYAAVGIRRVAREADVTPALVHYYFRTLDDLFLAVIRRRSEQELETQTRALESDRLLHSLWTYNSHPAGTALNVEFIALSNHRKAIRAELVSYAERARRLQMEALDRYLRARGIDTEGFPPLALTTLISTISRALAMEETMGLAMGHDEVLAVVEAHLRKIDDASARATE
ncbi:TetR/AcrR family transcriptional regulator [Actinomadura sp. WMMB 499]|uniref:TetR/AcrR family transcriptional regulator n=1 Tax=Actinomadura sp. WMMB 499 TaxID=1219491 RepID=UPI0012450418|nr:TetR/AcrR family transcriptional regulator [Actinomadura sp. WMMB 499]QFG21307.1 TetR/AcrR family transcriptional regulator [Actinomadura sp. WMMB 499]